MQSHKLFFVFSLFRVYKQLFEKEFGPGYGDGMMQKLKEKVSEINQQLGDKCAAFEQLTDDEFIVAICTPSMKRVHTQWDRSAEQAFLDSSGTMDRLGCRVFLLLTHSPIGGLPLGVFFCSSETEDILLKALHLFIGLLPPNAFGGKGKTGPSLFLTDDCAASRNALNSVFPSSLVYLCTFHVLQAIWRYLLDSKHGIGARDRQEVYRMAKEMLWAEDLTALHTYFTTLINKCESKEYGELVKYFKNLYERRRSWALCFRDMSSDNSYSLSRANNTNNICEAQMRVLKEKILRRVQSFNPVQLLEFLYHDFSLYYERKLTDAANGRFEEYSLCTRFYPDAKDITSDMVHEVSFF